MMSMSRVMLLGGALTAALSLPSLACAAEVTLNATLAGANETAGGSPKGSGDFSAKIDPDNSDLCYTLAVTGIGEVKAAHIHSGVTGKDGGVVTPLEVTGSEDECIALEPATLKAIVATPGSYYVNVHTADYPKGALRGQLVKQK